MHSTGTCQVGAQGAPCERAGAATAGDALTSFPQKQNPTEPDSLGTTVLPASGTAGDPWWMFWTGIGLLLVQLSGFC